MQSFDAVLLIDKPVGITSFDVIRRIKRLGQSYDVDLKHIGHGGTLDPFASGLLIVAVGRATRLTRHLLHGSKRYLARIALGRATASGDPETDTVQVAPLPRDLKPEDIRTAAMQWLKPQTYWQRPPMYSAIKKDGRRLYELARLGIEVERQARACTLWDFEIGELAHDRSYFDFSVRCSGGTYIRTLGEDLARALGTVGHLSALRRLESLHFSVSDAIDLDELEDKLRAGLAPKDWGNCVIPFDDVLQFLPQTELSDREERDILHGKQEHLSEWISRSIPTPPQDTELGIRCALYRQSRLVGIAVYSASRQCWELERAFQREVT